MKKNRLLKFSLFIGMGLATLLLVNQKNRAGQNKSQAIQSFSKLQWICYAPTHYNPREMIEPSPESIRKDLTILKKIGFDGIITYECNGIQAEIPKIADTLGLDVILGVWGPVDKEELKRAVAIKDAVVAYCVGNEGLGVRYSLRELDEGATYLANITGLPVAISEQIHLYFEHPDLLEIGDWLFPIVHPHFGNAKSFDAAVKWVEEKTQKLRQLAYQRHLDKVLFVKEIGMPSSGDHYYTEENQAQFLEYMLRQEHLQFALFEAFDRAGWEYISPVEPFWGICREDRSLKIAAKTIQQFFHAETNP